MLHARRGAGREIFELALDASALAKKLGIAAREQARMAAAFQLAG